jgi:hypothetical protein
MESGKSKKKKNKHKYIHEIYCTKRQKRQKKIILKLLPSRVSKKDEEERLNRKFRMILKKNF